jgi:hypothetical protein
MLSLPGEQRMTDISSVTSTATAFIAKQTADLNRAAGVAKTGFANALAKVEAAVGIKPSTGFVAGPTFEAHTIVGQTKTAFNNALNATKAALHIKP